MKYIKRHITDALITFSKEFKVVFVIGGIQVGKSTLLKHVFKDINYVAVDDYDLIDSIKQNPKLYFMDTGLVAKLTELNTVVLLEYSSFSGAIFDNYSCNRNYKIMGKCKINSTYIFL